MTSRADIDAFAALQKLAIVGVSRDAKKFGNSVFRELSSHGYTLYPIHPEAAVLEGVPAYKDFASLPEKVEGVIIIIQPEKTEQVVRAASAAGIRNVWMQQGAQSEAAIRFCQENGIREIHGQCINMFAHETASFHRIHRGIWKFFGLIPK